MSDHLLYRHMLVLKGLGGALTLGNDQDATSRLRTLLVHGLVPEERAWLLHVVLDAAEPHDAMQIIDDYLANAEEGPPLTALDAIEVSARWWASLASGPDIRAACFVRLPTRERAEFLAYASGRIAA